MTKSGPAIHVDGRAVVFHFATPLCRIQYDWSIEGSQYILPFVFVFTPALILRGTATEALQVIPRVAIGLVIISGALEGYFWRLGNLTILGRVMLFVTGMMVIDVLNAGTTFYGIGGFIVVFGLAYLLRARSPGHKIGF